MSEKRRDNRSRILHVGEIQRPDGRYAYKYKALNGDYKFVKQYVTKSVKKPRRVGKDKNPKAFVALSKSWFFREDRSNEKDTVRLPRHYLN